MKRRLNPFRLVVVILAAILLIALVVIVVIFGLQKKEQRAFLTEIAVPAGQSYVISGKRIAYLTPTALMSYEVGGKRNAMKELPLHAALSGFDINGELVAAYAGSTLAIGTQEPLQLNGEIEGVRCGKTRVAALRKSTAGDNDSIAVFDATNAAESADIPRHSEGRVIDFGFYVSDAAGSTHEFLWAIVVSLRTSLPVYTVTVWEYANDANGIERFRVQFHEQAIEKLYITDESFFVIGTQDIIRYSVSGGKEKFRVSIYGQRVEDAMNTVAGVSFLLVPCVDKDRQTLRILGLAETDELAESMATVHFQVPYIAALFSGGVLQVYSSQYLYTVNTGGKRLLELELPQAPLRVYKLDGGNNVLFETAFACYLASIA